MTFDWSVIITASLAVAAIISPILVAVINNHHNYKIRKLELATDKKIENFERLCEHLSIYLNDPTDNNYRHYLMWYQKSVIYMSGSTLETMNEINRLIEKQQTDIVQSKYLTKLCKQLQKDLGVYKRRK